MSDAFADVQLLIKRLELLKNVISLQDIEDINTQATKLEKLVGDIDDTGLVLEITWIIDLVKSADYGDAMWQTEQLINRFKAIIVLWDDPEMEGLKAEITVLTAQINQFETELAELEQVIFEFEARQTRELGELALKVLTHKRKRAASTAEQKAGDPAAEQELKDAQTEEDRYKGDYEEKMATPLYQLDEDQLKELKTKFKRIVKLTHPDLVDKRFEKEAIDLFRKAKHAKDINDLATITGIYDYLVNDKPFILRHETLTEIESLRTEARYLHNLVDKAAQKITAIKNTETYQTIAGIGDWGLYFNGIKEKMQFDLANLEVAL